MGLLDPMYGTLGGAVAVHLLFILSWTVGGLMVAVACFGLSSYTYGLSFIIFGVVAMEGRQSRQIWSVLCLIFDLFLGPRSMSLPGFGAYWFNWVWLATMSFISWFYRFQGIPSFVTAVQKMNYGQWYETLDVRGALDDVQKEKSLFGFHPHGILCIGFSLNGVWNKKFREAVGDDTEFLVDKVLREDNPFFKVICDFHGGIRTLCKSYLHKAMGKGTNVAFVPGGFEDATVMAYGKDRTAMKKRQGFVKYALQHGYRLHPVYTFGESNSYYTYTGAMKFRLWLNTFGMPAVVIFGHPLMPLMPRRDAKIITYVGKAIQLPKIENPSKEEVQKWHTTYLEALENVFEENKKAAGLADSAKLEIW